MNCIGKDRNDVLVDSGMSDDFYGVYDYVYDVCNRDIFVLINGELKYCDEVMVFVFESGYLFGDGVWEGLCVYVGGVVFLEEYLKWFYVGVKMIDMDIGLIKVELM